MDKLQKVIAMLSVGVITGLINGIFGGGGGMIIVPILTLLLCFENKKAHATAILIILPISLVSACYYIVSGSFELAVGLPVAIGVTVGGVIGAFALKKLSSKWVSVIFAVVMATAGVKMLFFR